jgi:glucose/arabinose dehydrogenase
VRVSAPRHIARPTFVVALLAAVACGKTDNAPAAGGADTSKAAAAGTSACPGGNAELTTLPSGFCATVFADSIAHGRDVVVAPNGDVYVTIEGTQPSIEKRISGVARPAPTFSFVALRDTNHDGHADIIKRVGSLGNTGIGLFDGYLYVDEGARIVRYARPDTQLVPTGRAEVVVQGIPMSGGHRARNFTFGSDSGLYLNIGSATNSCQRTDRETESPGIDPCTELETRAGIWRFNANKLGQRPTLSNRFATGLRNGMGLAFGPDGRLYATQHGRDQLHDNWPKVFPTTQYQAQNPAEELVQVDSTDDFGWPYCYYAVDQKKLVDAPEYGGDGKKQSTRCAEKKGPVATYPGHWAPMALVFYNGSKLPAKYNGGAFISFHGSWNRAPEPQDGYRVVFQPMSGGTASGAYDVFADGFAGVPPAQLQPGTAKHRPTGLTFGPDGALYVTDDMGGRVYRITYGGGQ